MKKLFILFVVLITIGFENTKGWGFFGHKMVNRLAIFAVPSPLIGFYKQHIEYLTAHSVDPDKRRYATPDEAARHYLDADHYEQALPLDTIPRKWFDAVAKYTEDSLKAYGIVPWHIELMTKRLTSSFKAKDISKILRISAEIGHYIGDCHVPLHATSNYNGHKTNQSGIHGFWESRLPELFSSEYDFYVGKAEYIQDVNRFVWEAFEGSVTAVDSVLRMERELNERFPADKKYAFEQRGQATMRVYSYEYSLAYHRMLSGMVERRMRATIKAIASIWYTAWVDAGQPNLTGNQVQPQTPEEIKEEAEMERKKLEGNIIGRDEPSW